MKCTHCHDTGWVCENHADRPWEGPHACTCGGAGMPCPICNDTSRSPPAGFKTEFDKKGRRH
jgi:hypothetical protein